MGGVWAGYSRVSRVGDRAERLISPELQQERITEYAAARGLNVDMLEPELDVSGGQVERPILSEILRGVEQGRYAGIIVAQLDRLSRMDIVDAVRTARRIEDAGGQVISVAENFDATTPEGRMGRNVMFAVADMQLGRYKTQFAQAKARAVENGIWPNSTVPIGYTVTPRKHGGDGKLRINPAAARKVRRAFEQRARGEPWNALAKTLGMSASGATRVIANRAYLGEIKLGDLVNPEGHEPIVDRGLWHRAQSQQPRPPRARETPRPALLTGLVRCAGCQHAMSPNTDKDGIRIYRCMRRVKTHGRCGEPALVAQHLLDDYVEAVFLHHAGQLEARARQRTAQLAELERAVGDAEGELVDYQKAVSVSALGQAAFLAGMEQRAERLADARAKLATAQAAAGPAVATMGGPLADIWPNLSVEDRRHVLRRSLAVVWVRKGRRNIPARTRIIAAGYGPAELSRGGRRSWPIAPLPWPVGHLEGELRAEQIK